MARSLKSQFRVRPQFLFVVVVLLFTVWIACTQPIFLNLSNVQVSNKASSTNLKRDVRKISEDFFPRDFESIENLNRLADYLKTQFQQFSSDVQEQKYSGGHFEYKNIIVKFGPSTRPVVVIGAHYDSCEKYPGADDNASGIAGLIELARLLKQHPPTAVSVELVAYSTEEPPFFGSDEMGSFIHARSLKAKGLDVRAMLSLEMIGYFSDVWGSQDFPAYMMRLFYPTKGNFIAVVSNFSSYSLTKQIKRAMQPASDLPVYSINGPSTLYGIDYSDHRNYWHFGFPAAMITDTAFLRNKAYHKSEDTFDRLDYEKMAKVIDGVYNTTFSFDVAADLKR